MAEQSHPEQSYIGVPEDGYRAARYLWLEIGSVEVVVVETAGLVRVTTTGDGKEATAYLHPDDADQLASLARGAALKARGSRS